MYANSWGARFKSWGVRGPPQTLRSCAHGGGRGVDNGCLEKQTRYITPHFTIISCITWALYMERDGGTRNMRMRGVGGGRGLCWIISRLQTPVAWVMMNVLITFILTPPLPPLPPLPPPRAWSTWKWVFALFLYLPREHVGESRNIYSRCCNVVM